MADIDDTTVPLSQLLYTHEKTCNLARGPLSEPVLRMLHQTAKDLALEIGLAPAMSWEEFDRKLGVLLDDWLDGRRFRDVIREDICRLALSGTAVAQAAE